MDLNQILNDERLLANLIGVHAALGAILVVSVVLRRMLKQGGDQVSRWTGVAWLDNLAKESAKGLRAVLFWSTVLLMVAIIVAMVVFHVSGRDLRIDVKDWFNHLTGATLASFGLLLTKLVGLALGIGLAFRLLRKARISAEVYVHHHLPKHVHPDTPLLNSQSLAPTPLGNANRAEPDRRSQLEQTIQKWFTLLERFGMAILTLCGLWVGGRVLGLMDSDSWAKLALRVVTFLMVARLLTLSCRTIFHLFANLGKKHLDQGKFHHYWERIARLFPLGERCFEAAIWIFAASQCAEALSFIGFVAKFGTAIVQCIGIFFGTRVMIEVLHVFINEAFGMYREDHTEDPKGQTLVPLLESLSQYVVYFGCVLMMLGVFEVDTTPILAGAGVVGLAVGLGAQNLVADVVAGFFILFENQFLVGDIVQVGDACGRVEALNIRNTQIRDDSGKLYFIPNGQIKTVINYSKGYVNAVVDIKVPTSANLDQVMRDMAEAGRRLRERRREVTGETVVKGLVELTPCDMTLRAVTKVQPGTHVVVQLEFRRILKDVFDEATQSDRKLAL
ncbi:MAG: mechanosensitive ion channel family protein [Gemmataceae bacterium]|nr:mechanosensitive ion channel family protein [Gemmataceae bacterium]